MHSLFLLLASAATAVVAAPYNHVRTGEKWLQAGKTFPARAQFRRQTNELPQSNNTLTLKRHSTTTASPLFRAAIDGTPSSATVAETHLRYVAKGLFLTTEIDIGGQTFQMIVDTGSSDFWVVGSDFTCTDQYRAPVGGNCNFGPAYHPSTTFKEIPGKVLNSTLGDGEYFNGQFGNDTVCIAGIEVPTQEFAVVTEGFYSGDGASSGILGFAYPGLTSIYNSSGASPVGTSQKAAPSLNPALRGEYNPLFTTMVADGLIDPIFTLVIEREEEASTLTLGGLPTGEWDMNDFISTPIMMTQLTPFSLGKFATERSYYTINVTDYTYTNASALAPNSSALPLHMPTGLQKVIVDSGTPFAFFPSLVTYELFSAYSMPTSFDQASGYQVVSCNATAPHFGIKIGDATINIAPSDLIVDIGLGGGKCACGVQAGNGATNVLGDTFLRNVVAVFDVGAAQMRFAQR